jgi:hypothetical protein
VKIADVEEAFQGNPSLLRIFYKIGECKISPVSL